MNGNLDIEVQDVLNKIRKENGRKYILLRVNYFGFSDKNEEMLFEIVRNMNGLLLEDNAHGFFTYHFRLNHFCDATFFAT